MRALSRKSGKNSSSSRQCICVGNLRIYILKHTLKHTLWHIVLAQLYTNWDVLNQVLAALSQQNVLCQLDY